MLSNAYLFLFFLVYFKRQLEYISSVLFGIVFHVDKAGFEFNTLIFVLAERPKYTFDFSEEEDDDADDDDDNNDLEELKVKASPITNDGEDEFVPSDGLDKDEYTFSPGKSKASPE